METQSQEYGIYRDNNKIIVKGRLGIGGLHPFLATLYSTTVKRGYLDVILDFSECTGAIPATMLTICSRVMKITQDGISITAVKPSNERIERHFRNTNWLHLLDPYYYDKSKFRGYTHVPATQFTSSVEQTAAVDAMVKAILSSRTNFTRDNLRAIEWSLNEITDNVLNHAKSTIGGLVQVTRRGMTNPQYEFIVCDAGIGIPNSLREGHSDLRSDSEALELAIREGVTRSPKVGQGNGLFGTYQICSLSGGFLEVHSGYSHLETKGTDMVAVLREQVPLNGTMVNASIDCSTDDVLENALRFGGKPHIPIDFIDTHYGSGKSELIQFRMLDESNSFGSREAGKPVRGKLSNLSRLCVTKRIIVDFTDVQVISSSYADEVFGLLFVELGPLRFMKHIEFVNVTETVRGLIDKAITQRVGQEN